MGFVDFNVRAGTANGSTAVNVCHVLADQPSHAPRRLVGHPKLALQFLGADTMPRGGEQVDRVEPELQRSARLLEGRLYGRVQVMTAPLARIGPLCLDAIPVRRPFARRAGEVLLKAHIE